MNQPIPTSSTQAENQTPQAKKKPNILIYAAIAIFFCIALYNVYSAYSEKKRVKAQQEAQRIETLELKKQQQLEAQRQAELEQAQKLQELEQQKLATQLAQAEQKLQQQQKMAEYQATRQAQVQAKEDKRLQRRIDDARTLHNPEGLPSNTVQGIQQATYLTIRNNPKDYLGNYQPQSILKSAKLTKGGADGLMLFSMVSTDLKAIAEVIQIGNDVNAQNKSGFTPLMFASAYNTSEVVSFLIEQGAKKETTEYITEGNALHVASRYNPKPEVVEALIKAGFDLEARDKDGNTPLLLAVKYNQNLQVVEKLVELGADISASDATGNVAYSHALKRTQKKVPMGRFKRVSREYEDLIIGKLK
ncbi:MAG: ankyrin repeat domain-containing protein [Arenicella sp.]